MRVRVTRDTLVKQLEISGQMDYLEQLYHQHLGEVNVTERPDQLKEVSEERNIVMLE
jgi:asparagine synthetase A